MTLMSHNYDLHTHSIASDGTLTPTQLVEAAAAEGVRVLALTDHDSTAGIEEAQQAACRCQLSLVPGVEISVTWRGQVIHVLGLNVTPGVATLEDGLEKLRAYRDWRAQEMGRRLAAAGIPKAYEAAVGLAKGSIVSRTHFARYLVSLGRVPNVPAVFKQYLVRGKPGYVPGEWAPLEEAVDWILAAGGSAVIAHPARYKLTATKLRMLLGQFRECGGVGLEVVSGSHGVEDVQRMAEQARRLDLVASVGSDYHGPEHSWAGLGRLQPLPHGCVPIWSSEHWPNAVPRRASVI